MLRSRKLLVIDDDPSIRSVVERVGSELGLEVCVAADSAAGLQLGLAESYEMAILDSALPGTGIDLCRLLREGNPALPIVILTTRSDESDKVLGLEVGADDYVTKPCSVHELTARIAAILRRKHAAENTRRETETPEDPVLRFDGLTIDPRGRVVVRDDCHIELSALEFDIIVYLAKNAGRVVSRNELLEKVWGYAADTYDTTVTTNLSRIRMKLERDPENPRYVQTVRGVGYRFHGC